MKNTLTLLFLLTSTALIGQDVRHPELFKSQRNNSYKSEINLYYNPVLDKYDIYFVKLDLEVSDESTFIQGNATLEIKTTEPLDTLLFDFSTLMSLDSIYINDKKVSANHSNNILEYIFDTSVKANEKIKVQIFYHGTPHTYGGGVTNDFDSEWNKNVTWTLSESFHAMEWWPCKQVLSDKIDSVYLFFTCDKDCMVGSNGLLENVVDLPNSKKRFEWKSFYPINYYLISFAVAEYQDYSFYVKPEGSNSVLIQNFVYNNPGYLTYNGSKIDETSDLIVLFSEKFGLYPFSKEKYGHCLTTLGGGMEHQTMTTLGSFNFGLVAHELGHMWFGDYVTCASWQDIWINEGFASYTEYVALENLKSYNEAQYWMENAHNYALDVTNESVYIPFEDAANEGRIFSYRLSYKKGAALVHMLRHEINDDELFFSALQNYLEEYRDSVATGEDFKNSLEQSTGMEFDPFFDQWYYGKGYPRFDINYTQVNDTLMLTVNQTTSSPEPSLYTMHVDYKIQLTDGDTTIRVFQSQNEETYKVHLNSQVTNIILDPDNWILNAAGTINSVKSSGSNQLLFSIYPNPATESLTIDFNAKLFGKEKQIEVLDLTGRLIMKLTTNDIKTSVNISDLSKGIYLIKGSSESKSYTYKFVKE